VGSPHEIKPPFGHGDVVYVPSMHTFAKVFSCDLSGGGKHHLVRLSCDEGHTLHRGRDPEEMQRLRDLEGLFFRDLVFGQLWRVEATSDVRKSLTMVYPLHPERGTVELRVPLPFLQYFRGEVVIR